MRPTLERERAAWAIDHLLMGVDEVGGGAPAGAGGGAAGGIEAPPPPGGGRGGGFPPSVLLPRWGWVAARRAPAPAAGGA